MSTDELARRIACRLRQSGLLTDARMADELDAALTRPKETPTEQAVDPSTLQAATALRRELLAHKGPEIRLRPEPVRRLVEFVEALSTGPTEQGEVARELAAKIENECVQVDYDYLGFDTDRCIELLLSRPVTNMKVAEAVELLREALLQLPVDFRSGELPSRINAFITASSTTEGPCILCVAECRGHPLGDEEAWKPEPGSRAWREEQASTPIKEGLCPHGQPGTVNCPAVPVEEGDELARLDDLASNVSDQLDHIDHQAAHRADLTGPLIALGELIDENRDRILSALRSQHNGATQQGIETHTCQYCSAQVALLGAHYLDQIADALVAAGAPRSKTLSIFQQIEALGATQGDKAFKLGDRVTKIKGSSWTGRVVGTYATALTPEGYAVESENEPGSVQIYPASALSTSGADQ